MAAFRTLWAALVGLYEETLVLLEANVASLVLNLPVLLILVVIGIPLGVVFTEDGVNGLFFYVVGALLIFMPTPGNVALGAMTQIAAGPDVPRFSAYRDALRRYWRLAARSAAVSVLVLAILVWNVTFYLNLGPGWPFAVTIFWLYASLFWLSLHVYFVPLMVHVAEPRVLDLYRRAAFISLGHALYTVVLLVVLLVIAVAAVVFLPVYVLVGSAFVSLAQAHALREIRRRHGDLPVDVDEGIGRL
jgi:uncharacterized membrane protein YesL